MLLYVTFIAGLSGRLIDVDDSHCEGGDGARSGVCGFRYFLWCQTPEACESVTEQTDED